ncbi:MAG: hypothetical protein ACLUGY_24525 [Phocaeicola massiliensis]
METLSKKNETETEDVRILREETKKALKTLYSIGTDAEEFKALPLSESTRAIYARRKVSDALESLLYYTASCIALMMKNPQTRY